MLGTPSAFREIFKRLCGIMPLFLNFIIFNNNSNGTILHSSFLIRQGLFFLVSSSLLRSPRQKPPWGDEPRIELGPALQQADSLPTEPRHTLIFENCSFFSPLILRTSTGSSQGPPEANSVLKFKI
jgi:hypothetical protein